MSPSRLNLPRRQRFFAGSGNTSATRAARQETARFLVAGQPWGGFCPDLSTQQLQPADAITVNGLISHQGELRPIFGYERINSTQLPLGGTTPPAAAGSEEAVVVVGHYRDLSADAILNFCITAGSPGHFYEDTSSAWTNRAVTGAGAAAITGTAADLVDFAYFPPDNLLIFCNSVDAVYQFANGTTYTEFNSGDTWAGGSDTDLFQARSVEVAHDRVIFLNTLEGGGNARVTNRIRWTTTGGSAVLTPSSTGAGFIDAQELGEGYRVMRLGPVLACYFDDGVAFLRRTGRATEAYSIEYVSQTRGLLGPQTVVDIGGGTHFGLFTDGWFKLHATGEWEEVGLRTIGDKQVSKWRTEFYDQFNLEGRHRAAIYFDDLNQVVYISASFGDNTTNSQLWYYDMNTDTAWPDNTYVTAHIPNCWGNGVDQDATRTWADSTNSWAGTTASWGSFATRVSRFDPTHGTETGLIFRHDTGLVQRDGVDFSYEWEGPLLAVGDPTQKKVLDKVHVGYVRLTNADASDPTAITVRTRNEDTINTATLAQTKGADGTNQIDFISDRLAGNYIGMGVQGTTPVRIRELVLEHEIQGDQETSIR